MSNDHGKATFVPASANQPQKLQETSEKTPDSLMESLYWQNLGWVHTPPFTSVRLDGHRLRLPGSSETPSFSQMYLKKSFYPKLQVENRVPYRVLPKSVAIDIKKRKIERQDLKKILLDMGLENNVIQPPLLNMRDTIIFQKNDAEEGIPKEPFLDLALFDDDYLYETRSPKEWIELGYSDDEKKPVRGTAFIPVDSDVELEVFEFDWQKVAVLDCDEEKKSYLVRNEKDCQNDPRSVLKTEKVSDLWVQRIYLKFDAEESLRYAQRLHTAVATRHIVEESVRMSYYVENMPIEDDLPKWSQKDIEDIISVARRSRQLQPKLQWIKNELKGTVEEIHLQFRKAVNYQAYIDVTGQNPNLIGEFENEPLGDIHTPQNRSSFGNLKYCFKDRYERFSYLTLYNQVGVIKAFNSVQSEILALSGMSLYSLSFNDVASLDRFKKAQKIELQKVERYLHGPWSIAIANSVTSNIASCDEIAYDTNQTVLHTFRMTKLGKLLRLVGYKMQDVIRFLVLENMGRYTQVFQEASINLEDVKDGFVWPESFVSDKWVPRDRPVFEVSLEIRGVHLEFVVDLKKHRDTVVELFDEGLRVTQGLPRLEKLVMKKLLYNPENKLETVGSWEEQICSWKKTIISGMDKATRIATSYARHYDATLEAFAEDPINYVKRLSRSRTSCGQLKAIVEMHRGEGRRLDDAIPDFVDVGPLRLATATVRVAATRKHRQLGDAVLDHFHDRLRQDMESIRDQFLVLLDRIDQGTGNIEDLLDKKAWCRGVPKKIERLSVEVNTLRSDCRMLMDSFNRNMDDDDFSMYWRVQELPQITAKRLAGRTQNFDQERDVHKQNLASDLRQLKVKLDHLSHQVALLRDCWDSSRSSSTATDVRRIRKELTSCADKANLYNKRERLFGQPQTDYPEIEKMAQDLLPYELFWLNAAEFVKYRERVVGEELKMEASELKEKVLEFRENLEKSLEYFVPDSDPKIHEAVISVMGEVDNFLQSKWVLQEQKREH